jgi:DNA-binding CsgD family transcriptional regulator/tetratricopeptide (TPR) repeat protein
MDTEERLPFVGRGRELSRILDCAAQARAGLPWTVGVEGEAGVGKSALARRATLALQSEGFKILRAACAPVEADLNFGVVGQLAGREHAPAKSFQRLLNTPGITAVSVGARLLDLLDEMQSTGPVAMLIDDAQWADPGSLQALSFALRRLEADAVLTVFLLRPGEASQQVWQLVLRDERTLHLLLPGLTTDDVAQLAQQAGHQVSEGEADILRRETGGNPLYLQAAIAHGLADVHSPGGFPPSLTALVRQQLSQLPAPTRLLAQAIAVLDGPVSVVLASRVAGLEGALESVDSLVARGLIQWEPGDPLSAVQVRHPLLRHGILATAGAARLRSLHAAAAHFVPEADAWAHRVAACDSDDAELAADLARAAETYMVSGEPGRTATLLLWAAEVSPGPHGERRLLSAAAVLIRQGHHTRVETLMPRILACAPSGLRSLVLGARAIYRGSMAHAEELLTGAHAAGEAEGEEQLVAMASAWLSLLYMMQGRGMEAQEAASRALAAGLFDETLLASTRGVLSLAHALQRGPSAGLATLEELNPQLKEDHATPRDALTLAFRGILRTSLPDFQESERDLRGALSLGRSAGRQVVDDYVYGNLATDAFLRGDWDACAMDAEAALTVSAAQDRKWYGAVGNSLASWVPAIRGDWKHAQALLRTAVEVGHDHPSEVAAVYIDFGQALLSRARRDHAGVVKRLVSLLPQNTGWPLLTEILWLPLLAESLIVKGQLDEAATALDRLDGIVRQSPYLSTAQAWLAGLFAEAQGNRQAAHDAYGHGTQFSVPLEGSPFHMAQLEEAYGRSLMSEGRDGRELLRKARMHYMQLGAQPFAAGCDDVLAESVVTAASDSTSQLTKRERDISLLVGRGMTNREIATELFLSSKTVEYHLRHVFEKLNISNRRELRNVVQATQSEKPSTDRSKYP